MTKRPTSITVISCLFIITSAFSLLGVIIGFWNPRAQKLAQEIMVQSPLPVSIQYAFSFTGLTATLASGIFMLRGANWARYLYIIWGAISLLLNVFTTPTKLAIIPGLAIYGIIVFFLMQPRANEYFNPSATTPDQEQTTS